MEMLLEWMQIEEKDLADEFVKRKRFKNKSIVMTIGQTMDLFLVVGVLSWQ